MLAFWMGGAAMPVAPSGPPSVRSMSHFWLGGASAAGTGPPTPGQVLVNKYFFADVGTLMGHN